MASSNSPVLPMTEALPLVKDGIPAWAYVVNWMFFSNLTIVFNKWLIDNAGFKYPIILTCWHLVFATVATQILARTTSLLDTRKKIPINGRFYLRTIIPIGLLYCGSLVCSNQVYLYLSVAFIQMLKSASPVAVLFTSWAWGVADPNLTQLLNILVIVLGVGIASLGEIQFSWIGFFFQLGGIVFEAMRVVMIQVMLNGEGLKMDPLVSLYYYAPVCAIMNLFIALVIEVPSFQWDSLAHAGFGMLFLNALVAFVLNVASVFLIGKTSGLVMTLTGILKSILLVAASVFIWSTQITLLQGIGYGVALAGLVYYSLGYDQLVGMFNSSMTWINQLFDRSSSNGGSGGATTLSRRTILIRVFLLLAIVVFAVLALNMYRSNKLLSLPVIVGTH